MLKVNKVKVVKVSSDGLEFDNGVQLTSNHDSDCCESHYLSLADLTIADFAGLEFDLTSDAFFERINGYGIALKPLAGHPVRIPGYGINNGCYLANLDLVLSDNKVFSKVFDVSECQVIEDWNAQRAGRDG
jgi:hypothetical protein